MSEHINVSMSGAQKAKIARIVMRLQADPFTDADTVKCAYSALYAGVTGRPATYVNLDGTDVPTHCRTAYSLYYTDGRAWRDIGATVREQKQEMLSKRNGMRVA